MVNRLKIIKEIETAVEEVMERKIALREEMSLIDDLGLDSLDRIEISLELENLYHIDILEEDLSKVKTVKDVIDLIFNYTLEK